MTRCAIAMSRSADVLRASLVAVTIALLASPVAARNQDQPVAGREPDAQDVAMTPLNDLNLSKDEIPAVLITAATDPYSSDGLDRCPAIQAAIADLDAALGPDMDVANGETDRLSTGRMAKSVVASFIPFRGILREITGAAGQERALQSAIYAGAVRRGFLKGLGQQKGCAYPARPAFTRVAIAPSPPPAGKPRKGDKGGKQELQTVTFVEDEVVQPVPRRR